MGLFHDSNDLWKNNNKKFTFIISFNLGYIVSQPSNPMDSPTIILYSYFINFQVREAENQRELGHIMSSSLSTLVLFRLTNNNFLCQSDVKRWSLSHHRIVSFRMSDIHVTFLKWSQDSGLSSHFRFNYTPSQSMCEKWWSLQKACSYCSLEYLNTCSVLSNIIYCLNLTVQGNTENKPYHCQGKEHRIASVSTRMVFLFK